MSYKWIRASEISDYVYCRRSWWLRRMAGVRPENVRQLASGIQYHQQHGDGVLRAIWARRVAYALLFLVIAFIAFQITLGL